MSSLGVLEDKVKVIIKLAELPAGINLTPGATVDVTITIREARNVLAVPKEAVFTDQGQKYVWLIKNGKAVTVPVSTGIEGDDLIEVKTGLRKGDSVLLNPHHKELKEGSRIKQS
jgi:HlyD family secretion protein